MLQEFAKAVPQTFGIDLLKDGWREHKERMRGEPFNSHREFELLLKDAIGAGEQILCPATVRIPIHHTEAVRDYIGDNASLIDAFTWAAPFITSMMLNGPLAMHPQLFPQLAVSGLWTSLSMRLPLNYITHVGMNFNETYLRKKDR